MQHLLKLGPVDVTGGYTNVYLSIGEDGAVGPPIFGVSDLEAVRALVGESKPEDFCCEPSLDEAARVVGVSLGEAPNGALQSRAAIAVYVAWKKRALLASSDVALSMLQAATDFWSARPWLFWTDRQPIEVRVTGQLEHTYECSVFGGAEQCFGIALYESLGGVEQFFEFQQAGRVPDARLLPAIGLMLDDQPAYATEALLAAGRVPRLPMPVKSGPQGITAPSVGECLALVATLQALSGMGPGRLNGRAQAQSQDEHVCVRVVAPPSFIRN
ncbi:MAG: hypothetical protein K1X64_02425 [Myxococcaceae bacterium]|nr:hypothetical protein [Myxococcaceae bacterium]